jgi:pyruvate formate lyase activating enzyme
LECGLCPHHCVLGEGETGICHARGVWQGHMVAFNYGRICAQAIDQIEKKPIYHYRPGSKLLSIGTFGCNLDCDCCQNAVLASSGYENTDCPEMSAEKVVDLAVQKGVDGVAFTFNEPVIWHEFIKDVAGLARDAGLYTMMNSNGYLETGPLRELASEVDVFKVDVKGFTEEFYAKHCGGTLAPVLRTCEYLHRNGNHLELAYLIIPGLNDGDEELTAFFRWVVSNLSTKVPVHLYRFMPAHRLSHLPSTSMEAMRKARGIAEKEGLDFVYLSGMTEGEGHLTRCPRCGETVIEREAEESSEKIVYSRERLSKFCPSYSEIIDMTIKGICPKCGEIIYRSV